MADAVSVEPRTKGVSYATQLAEARELAKKGQLEGAIANLLQHEKTARLGGDIAGTTELAVCMVELCHEAGDHAQLNETISLLAKRRAQLKEAVAAVVRKACEYVEAEADAEKKLKLIETLRAVSEGKMHVEVERARLTKTLAGIHEANGELEEARKIMIETVVETLGGMDKREKTHFILEQVRLCLDTKEFVRAQIMARKINVKVFKDVEIEDLKLAYYALIVRYHLHAHTWLEIYRAYQSMWDAPSLQSDEAAKSRCLKLQTIYLVLSPYDNEQVDQLNRLATEKALTAEPMRLYADLLKLFITKELFHYADLAGPIRAELEAFGEFDAAEVKLMLETLHLRVTQHNIQVISSYYARISMERLGSLLGLSIELMEEQLCEMVTKKQVYARIDRPSGIIVFAAPKTANSLLNDWSGDISTLLNLVEGTCHLIHKENMVHKIAA